MWRNFFKPKNEDWRWAFCLSLGVYLFVFVVEVEPFKSEKIPYVWASTADQINHRFANFVLVFLTIAAAIIFLPKRFPEFFLPENLTLRRFSVFTILTAVAIEISYFFTDCYFFNNEITVTWFFTYLTKVTLSTFLFAGIPFFIGFLFVFNHFEGIKKYRQKGRAIDDSTKTTLDNFEEDGPQIAQTATPQYKTDLAPQILRFSDTSNRKNLDVPLDRFYYITSAQNYIEVFYKDKNAVPTRQTLRNSLKAIEENMITKDDNSPLIRCHKAFIVNREKVVELRGPAKTAHFILDGIDAPIPVSRQKYAELDEQFSTSNTYPNDN